MGRHHHKRRKSCAPCVPCETQVGNGLLNIAGIAMKDTLNHGLDKIGKTSLVLFDAIFPPPTGATNAVAASAPYTWYNVTGFNLDGYTCVACPPECPTTQTIFTNYVNYIISTGLDVTRLIDCCFTGNSNMTIVPSATNAVINFNATLVDLINAASGYCNPVVASSYYAGNAYARNPVTPQVFPPAVRIASAVPPPPQVVQAQVHNATNVQADCACAGDAAPVEAKAEVKAQAEPPKPEKKKGRIANIFSKLRKKVSNKSTDA